MDIDYKGYVIVIGSERDDATGLWDGRYRILDDKGIVVYETLVKPLHEEDKARERLLTWKPARGSIHGPTRDSPKVQILG
jgi:hypothetical protein